MDATHLFSLPMHANPRRLDPCVCREWVAVPIEKNVIGLWETSKMNSDDSNAKVLPVELNGHDKEITALAFSSSKSRYLASVSKDKILLWKLKIEDQQDIRSELFFSNPGEAACLCFNNNEDAIAMGLDSQVLLLKPRLAKPFAVFEAHRAMVTSVKFCPHYSSTLVSISDDRTFCVWDVKGMNLLYQSTIISPAPLISLSMNLARSHVAIGTADGHLKVFDLTDGHDFRSLADIDVAVLVRKAQSKCSSENNSASPEPLVVNRSGKQPVKDLSSDEIPASAQSSESVLSIQYAYFAQSQNNSSNWLPSIAHAQSSGVGDMIGERSPSICMLTSNACVQLDARSLQVLQVIDMHKEMKSLSFGGTKTPGSIAFAGLDQSGPVQMTVIVGAMFEKRMDVIVWPLVETNSQPCDDDTLNLDSLNEAIGIVPISPMLGSSPLKTDMLPSVGAKPVTKGDVATGKKKITSAMNQPLTFKNKIKSSGYTQAPRTTMFKPETSKSKLLGIGKTTSTKPAKQEASLSKMLKTTYDDQQGLPTEQCDTFITDHQTTAVSGLKFAGDGSGLACAMSNKSALVLKTPFSKQIFCSFTGHDGAINAVQWSHDNSLLLTSSNDKRAFLWSKSGGDPLIVLSHMKGNQIQSEPSPACSKKGSVDFQAKDNKTFTKEIKNAQFYFMDKFILMTYGSTLGLYKYHVTPEKDEIKRYNSRNRYKLVSSWETDSSSFTASAAVNSFLSYIVVCATSGRHLEVYDLNRSILAHSFEDCHSRPVHCIAINEGSCYANQPSDAHNVIASAALTDPIKLWDLRAKNNIQALQGHMNNAHACQIAFSPCGNYLATGSENKTAYIYDLRKGTYVERLRGHNEVVLSVAFHPAYPLIATGSLDSKINFYKSK